MSFSKMHCAKNPFKFKQHNMYKTKVAKTQGDHDRYEEQGYDHNPYKKMVPNCIPKGKLKKEKGDPCWDNYVQRGMKKK